MTKEDDLQKLIKTLDVMKGQFTKAKILTEGNPTLAELNTKLNAITEYWEYYKQVQSYIDSLTDKNELELEIECRYNVEDEQLQLLTKLYKFMDGIK